MNLMNEEKQIDILIKQSEKRIAQYIKEDFLFHHLTNALTNKTLRKHTSKRISMSVMYCGMIRT
jgi:hypothetical protein